MPLADSCEFNIDIQRLHVKHEIDICKEAGSINVDKYEISIILMAYALINIVFA